MGKVVYEEYLINGETMVILPHYDVHGHLHSLIVETDRELIIQKKPLQIINESCLFHGSSYKGRVEGATHLTNYNRMVPIMICNRTGIYMFPTQSPKSEACLWFSHDHIKEIQPLDAERCYVLLGNQKSLPVHVSKAAMELKVNRTAQFRHLMNRTSNQIRTPVESGDFEQFVVMESSGAYAFTEENAQHH
ncbi:competence protein ComK [Pseudalkalibacillus sp. SCS-8]|uniref:competence protein ComK n=1 Tax=Pseudalkalibacillus nanhaiensis TaxID=3115291 RepID=UPI0032DA0AD0